MNVQVASAPSPLTPRQDRLEAAIMAVLGAGGTRSELRELVYQYADLSRLKGLSAEHAAALVRDLGGRAAPQMAERSAPAVGDSIADRVAMMTRWCNSRYSRAD